MSEERNKNLSGALFKNDKGDNPNRPDYKGTYTDGNGSEFWMSAWVKESAKGVKYMSISMQPKEERKERQATAIPVFETEDDQFPF